MRNNEAKILMALLLSFVFLTACKSDPIEVRDKYYAKAQEYLDSQRYEEAVIEFRNALRTDGGHIPSYLGIAKAFRQMGNIRDAYSSYMQVIKLDDKNIQGRLGICECQIIAGTRNPEILKQAQQTVEEILKIDPSNVEAATLLLRIGKYQIVAGTNHPEIFKQAQETAEEVLKIDPSNIEGFILLGNAYIGQKEVDKAIAEYEKAIALDPINLEATLNLAAF